MSPKAKAAAGTAAFYKPLEGQVTVPRIIAHPAKCASSLTTESTVFSQTGRINTVYTRGLDPIEQGLA